MENRSIFFDEWIRSLREQYKFVIRNNDQVTLPSLTKVMYNVGFSDEELSQLRVEATMHVDQVGADFVPDMNVLKSNTAQSHAAECTCAQCIPIDESAYDADGQPLTDIDPEEATTETGHVFPVASLEEETVDDPTEPALELEEEMIDDEEFLDEPDDDPDQPKQMSMF